MSRVAFLAVLGIVIPVLAFGDFDPSAYQEITQAELVRSPKAHGGKKFQVTDPFQFCGSDFCVEIRKTKINTRDYFCFALGSPCMVRMYLRKNHPEAAQLQELKRGDKVTAYGTYDFMGSDYNFMVVDHITIEKKR